MDALLEVLESPPPNDQDRGPIVRTVFIVTTAACFVSLVFRLLGRGLISHYLGADDVFITLATALSVVGLAFTMKQVDAGGGRHMYYIIPHLFEVLKWTDLSELLLIPITAFTKISICIFVTRIPHSQRLKWSMYALMAFLAITNGVCFIAFLLQCRPMRAMWDLTIQNACWSQDIFVAFGYFQGATSVLTDLICSILPIAVLWKVQMSTKTKFAVCGLIATGLFASGCSLGRSVLLHVVQDPVDITWTIVPEQLLAILEVNIGILATNVPALIPFWRLLRTKVPPHYSRVRSYLAKRKMLLSKNRISGRWPREPRGSSEDTSILEPNSIRRTITHRVDFNAATATGKFGLPKIVTDGANLENAEKSILDVREWV